MLKRLGRVARKARTKAELTQLDIAAAAGVNQAVISNLELGKRWPRDVEVIIAVYESECGLTPNDLWRRAASSLP